MSPRAGKLRAFSLFQERINDSEFDDGDFDSAAINGAAQEVQPGWHAG